MPTRKEKQEVTCFSECVSSETQFHETTIHTGPRGRCPRSPARGRSNLRPHRRRPRPRPRPSPTPRDRAASPARPGRRGRGARSRRAPAARPRGRRLPARSARFPAQTPRPAPPRLELVELLCALVVVPVRRVEQRHVQRVDRELLEQQQLHAPYRVVVVHDARTRAADGVEPGAAAAARGGASRRFSSLARPTTRPRRVLVLPRGARAFPWSESVRCSACAGAGATFSSD